MYAPYEDEVPDFCTSSSIEAIVGGCSDNLYLRDIERLLANGETEPLIRESTLMKDYKGFSGLDTGFYRLDLLDK